MSDDSTNIRLTADISDFESKVEALQKRVEALAAAASNIRFGFEQGGNGGGNGGRGGWSGSSGGSQAFRESTQSAAASDYRAARDVGYTGSFNTFVQERHERRRASQQARAEVENERYDQAQEKAVWGGRDRQAKNEDWYTRYDQRLAQDADKQHWAGRDRQARDMDFLRMQDQREQSEAERQAEQIRRAEEARVMGFARGALYGVGRAAEQGLSNAAQQIATGNGNPSGMSGAYGGAVGGVIGAGVGTFFGPFGPLIGARVGEGVGNAAGMFGSAYSQARNSEAQAMFPYTYGLGQDAYAGFDAQAQRNPLSLSGMDTRFMLSGSAPPTMWETALRMFGAYNGNDQTTPQAQGSIERSLGTAAMNRGMVLGPDRLKQMAEDWALAPDHRGGEFGKAAAGMLDRYTGAELRFGGSAVDMLGALGTEGYLNGARAAGMNTDPRAIVAYQRNQAGNDRELRYDAQSTQAYGIEMAGVKGRGGIVGDDLFDGMRSSLRDSIKDTEAKLTEAIRIGGADSELAGSLRNAVRGFYVQIADSLHDQGAQQFQLGMGRNAVNAGNTAIQGTRTSLWGNAGDFSANVLPMQQADAQANIATMQARVNQLPDGPERLALQAQIRQTQAGMLMLPAQNQQADIGIAQGGFGAQRAEQGVSAAYAGLYGNVGDVGAVGQSRQGQIAAERSYWQNLTPQSRQQEFEKRARLAQLDQEQLQVRAGTASTQFGIEREENAQRLAGTGYDIFSANAYGSDVDVATAYQGQRMQRQSSIAVLTARANDSNLSRSDRMAAQREILSQRQGMMQDDISGRDVELGRQETRGGLRRGDTDFGLDRARRLGGASDYRNAVGAQMNEFGFESHEIEDQLASGGLTFDQRARLTRRQQGLRRESFSLQQQSIDEGFQKEDLEGYDVARLQSKGNLRRAQMLPFGMGNGLALELGQIGQNNARRGQLQGRYAQLEQSGNLSPERRMALMREDDSLQTENVESLSKMARGMEDYLPAMSAGAPTTFARYNTLNLAAMRMNAAGSPAGNYGFAGGRHEMAQQGMLRNLMGGPSLSSGANGMNTPLSGSRADWAQGDSSGQVVALLTQIANSLTQNNGIGGGTRPGDITGHIYGMLGQMVSPGQGKGAQFGR